MKILLQVFFAALCLSVPLYAQDRPTAYVGARIIPIAGAPIENGVLIVRGGKIVAVGSRASTTIPPDAVTVDVTGKVLMPGLVDSHSHIGEPQGGDGSGPIQPETRVLDSINVRAASIQRAQSGGITVANIMPGSGHLDSGQTLYLKLRDDAAKIDDLLIYDRDGKYMGGIKFANGTNSLRAGGTGPFPGTRAKSVSLVREQFIKAQEYRAKIQKAGSDASKLPERSLAMEALAEALDRKRVVHFHTHRHDDIMSVLRLQKEFGFRVVLHHVSEGWKVAAEIAKAKIPASIILIDSPGGKLETLDLKYETGDIMDKAGVLVGFHTDDYITDSRLFMREAALAVRAGMNRDKALYALTMANAIMLDLQDRIGSLEAGKDADFIVLSGDPLSVYTHVLQTYIDGKKVFDRSNPEDYRVATGGYGAGSDRLVDIDCFGGDNEGGQQ